MISICIPIFNYDIRQLVEEIIIEKKALNTTLEIICIDDCSSAPFLKLNQSVKKKEDVQFISLDENIGRSKIRNLFIKYAKYENLIFIDCDCSVNPKGFISNYIENIDHEVVYGGRKHHVNRPKDKSTILRWKYGKKKEDLDLTTRKKSPYISFRSNNFLVKKSILNEIRFNEQFSTYGHEDTQLAYDLKKKKVEIIHIDNPVFHEGLESNKDFLNKTEIGIKNLIQLKIKSNELPEIKLLSYYEKTKQLKINTLLLKISPLFIGLFRIQLESRYPSLIIFNIYKLLLLLRIKNNV